MYILASNSIVCASYVCVCLGVSVSPRECVRIIIIIFCLFEASMDCGRLWLTQTV